MWLLSVSMAAAVVAAAVPRLQFTEEALRHAIDARQPTVFTRTPADAWPWRRRWLLSNGTADKPMLQLLSTPLSRRLDDVASGPVNWNWDSGAARCDPEPPPPPSPPATGPRANVGRRGSGGCPPFACPACRGEAAHQRPLRNLSVGDLLHGLRAGRPLLYYSPITREFSALQADIDFRWALRTLRTAERARAWEGGYALDEAAFDEALVYLWLGGGGITTQCHYDLSHNFYVQLRGRKAFVLAAPGAARALQLFPRSHPGRQKSQIPWEQDYAAAASTDRSDTAGAGMAPVNDGGGNRSGLSRSAYWASRGVDGARMVVLEPGDVLYLPPTFFHHVTALPPLLPADEEAAAGLGATTEKRGWT
jgi:hypothetical protein